MADHIDTGNRGEQIAATYLTAQGYTILERNWHNQHQEIDIIATKGSELVIIEVKCRLGNPLTEPYTAVNKNKQNLLINATNAYILRKDVDMETRFDIISIIITGNETKIDHIKNAFYPRVRS